MITVAMAALAYLWFTGVFETLTGGANETITGTQKQLGTKFSIEAATNTTNDTVSVSIRNTGTYDIDLDKVATYITDDLKDNTASGTLAAGSVYTFNITNITSPCNKVLRITVETGADDTTSITCI
jgi:hypothetical protein